MHAIGRVHIWGSIFGSFFLASSLKIWITVRHDLQGNAMTLIGGGSGEVFIVESSAKSTE